MTLVSVPVCWGHFWVIFKTSCAWFSRPMPRSVQTRLSWPNGWEKRRNTIDFCQYFLPKWPRKERTFTLVITFENLHVHVLYLFIQRNSAKITLIWFRLFHLNSVHGVKYNWLVGKNKLEFCWQPLWRSKNVPAMRAVFSHQYFLFVCVDALLRGKVGVPTGILPHVRGWRGW